MSAHSGSAGLSAMPSEMTMPSEITEVTEGNTARNLRARVKRAYDPEQRRHFSQTQFLASLQGYKGNMQTGALDITFTVGPGEKEAALPVTNSQGDLLLITIKRVKFDGSE